MNNFYTIGAFLILLLWLFFFLLQDKSQKLRVLKYSLALSSLGPLSEIWYQRDYWIFKQFGVDLVFAFSLAGLGAMCLDTIFRKKWDLSENFKILPTLLVPYLGFSVWMFIFTNMLKINSIYSSSFYLAIVGLALGFKTNILSWVLLNGIFGAVMAFLIYFTVDKIFHGAIQSLNILLKGNAYIFNVPITEVMFYLCAGMAIYAGFKYAFSKEITNEKK